MNIDHGRRTDFLKTTGCEDFAISSTTEIGDGREYAIGVVSDGCGACDKAIFGSNMLGLAYHKVIRNLVRDSYLTDASILGKALRPATDYTAAVIEDMAFPAWEFFATALGILATEEKICYSLNGDGGFFYRRGGQWFGQWVGYKYNCPVYPLYDHLGGYTECFERKKGEEQSVIVSSFEGGERSDMAEYSVENYNPNGTIDTDGVDLALVVSDGLGEIHKKEEGDLRHLLVEEAVQEIFSFPSTKGRFVSRMMKSSLCKPRTGIYNYDDLSITAIGFDV